MLFVLNKYKAIGGVQVSLDNLEVSGLQWRKARRGIGNGACVEAAAVPASGQVLIRDSTAGPAP